MEWSPYGCQFYPPATAELAALNIDSLPKEPLATGEQYFIDLAGNIKKVRSSSVLCVTTVAETFGEQCSFWVVCVCLWVIFFICPLNTHAFA